MVIQYSFYQLITLILMKHFEELDDFMPDPELYKIEIMDGRMKELQKQFNENQDSQELNDEDDDDDLDKLIAEIVVMDDKRRQEKLIGDLKDLINARICEAEEFYYLTGLEDALQVFETPGENRERG